MQRVLAKPVYGRSYRQLMNLSAATYSGHAKNIPPGIARFLEDVKYQKVSSSQTSMVINLPDDMNFRGLELQTGLIGPSAILQTVTRSGLLFIFNPSDSFVDVGKLFTERLVFVKNGHAQISSDIYNTALSRSPISLECRLLSYRNSTIVYEVLLSSLKRTFAKFVMNGISVSMETRRAAPMPDWWQEKYKTFYEKSPPPHFQEHRSPNKLVCKGFPVKPYTFPVLRRDMDWNGHTGFAMYIQYCLDALEDHLHRNNILDDINTAFLPMKSVHYLAKGESGNGDMLTVEFWDDDINPGTVCFDVMKSGSSIYQAKLKVYGGGELALAQGKQ